jgi:D-alanyl-D-alanine dipeptidase
MRFRWFAIFILPALSFAEDSDSAGSRAREPMVDVAKAVPQVVIELRYATDRNLAKSAIYPKNARCFVRQGVAERLIKARQWLNANSPKGTHLKIWDAWRPGWAQEQLWKVMPNKEFVADPHRGHSLHTWGVAVDVTLCDADGRDLRMPTDFDVMSPNARTYYTGSDPEIKRNLRWLQSAMTIGGFQVLQDEWWHFVARDWKAYGPADLSLTDEPLDATPAKPVTPVPKKAASR